MLYKSQTFQGKIEAQRYVYERVVDYSLACCPFHSFCQAAWHTRPFSPVIEHANRAKTAFMFRDARHKKELELVKKSLV